MTAKQIRPLLCVVALLLLPVLVTGAAYLLARGNGAPGGSLAKATQRKPTIRSQISNSGLLPMTCEDADPCDHWRRLLSGTTPGTWRTTDSSASLTLWIYQSSELPPGTGPVWAKP